MNDKITLKRNKNTGEVESWKGRKKVGKVITMGDLVQSEKKEKDNGRN